MDTEDYYVALKDWFAYALLEACETLTKVFSDPQQASRNMNRLKRHVDYQLQETFRLAEDTVYKPAGGSR